MRGDSRNTEFHRVLMATDFSDALRNAFRYAAAIAGFNSARLYVVHVVSSVAYAMVEFTRILDHPGVGACDGVGLRIGRQASGPSRAKSRASRQFLRRRTGDTQRHRELLHRKPERRLKAPG